MKAENIITKPYIGYEYKKVTVSNETVNLWYDSMTNFGWKLEKKEAAIVKHIWGPLRLMLAPLALIPGMPIRKLIQNHESTTCTELTFKRDKCIPKKAELDRLQSQFEIKAHAIESLEDSKSFMARLAAYTVALLGTTLMAGAVFSFLASMIQLCIIFAVPAFIGWLTPYFIFSRIKKRKSDKVLSQIEEQYNNIYDICHKANNLLQIGI